MAKRAQNHATSTTPSPPPRHTFNVDGKSHRRGRRRATNNPAAVYALAPEAEQLFPKAYDPVLQQLLDVLSEHIAAEEIETFLREAGRRMAGRWKVSSGELRVRLGAAVEVFNELGGMAELEACNGHFC